MIEKIDTYLGAYEGWRILRQGHWEKRMNRFQSHPAYGPWVRVPECSCLLGTPYYPKDVVCEDWSMTKGSGGNGGGGFPNAYA